jgi:hypothetical protein
MDDAGGIVEAARSGVHSGVGVRMQVILNCDFASVGSRPDVDKGEGKGWPLLASSHPQEKAI